MRAYSFYCLTFVCALAAPAGAHDSWISREKFRDPQSGAWCCNEHDCETLNPGQVWHHRDSVSIATTYFGEQNEFVIPNERILPSRDEKYWACMSTESVSHDRGISLSVRCYFEPLVQ